MVWGCSKYCVNCGNLLTVHLPIPVLIDSAANLRADAYDRQDKCWR
jgi:hypothetical protein